MQMRKIKIKQLKEIKGCLVQHNSMSKWLGLHSVLGVFICYLFPTLRRESGSEKAIARGVVCSISQD